MSSFPIERTLAVIKPFAVQHRFSIFRRIFSAGFHILQVFLQFFLFHKKITSLTLGALR
jgi:nucleoside diphosphate kinase